MQDASRLYISFLGFLVFVSFYKILALVALLEVGLVVEALYGLHSVSRHGTQEHVVAAVGPVCVVDGQFSVLHDNGVLAVGHIARIRRTECQTEWVYDRLYQLRSEVGLATSAEDKQTLGGTGEGHIEQVHVVHTVLQMFIQVIFLVDSAHHAPLAEVYGYQRQLVEGSFGGCTPYRAAGNLQPPVT